jgi:hypothetical protein
MFPVDLKIFTFSVSQSVLAQLISVNRTLTQFCCVSLLLLLGNGSVKTFLQQRRIIGGVIFYADHDISKENRHLIVWNQQSVITVDREPLFMLCSMELDLQ